ncbi:hypothetical protein H7K32_08370 [Brevibacillus agri]|uniref:hypothetical protein n=1 Tax=Brevibacillus agri TaxID=51101 RepID=UPI001C8D19DD|nr:hypothetical protein [Brevibacillus agri]
MGVTSDFQQKRKAFVLAETTARWLADMLGTWIYSIQAIQLRKGNAALSRGNKSLQGIRHTGNKSKIFQNAYLLGGCRVQG